MRLARPLWPFPRIIAHRGGGILAPENTLAGLRVARSLGHVAVEFDAKLTADRKVILMHDDTLERTTSGKGKVDEARHAVVTRLDAGSWFGNEFAGETVPDFKTTAKLCREAGLWPNIEIKPCPGRERETGEIVGRQGRELWQGASLPPLLSSFSPLSLEAAAVEAPELPRALLVEDVPSNWQAQLERLQCVALHVHHAHLSREQVAGVHAAGFGVLAYTVNDSELALDLLDWGVDALVTDQIEVITPHFAD
ncbi:MAG: glycerophosphodiester phosphodiesterase [Burkholderiales bacterium]